MKKTVKEHLELNTKLQSMIAQHLALKEQVESLEAQMDLLNVKDVLKSDLGDSLRDNVIFVSRVNDGFVELQKQIVSGSTDWKIVATTMFNTLKELQLMSETSFNELAESARKNDFEKMIIKRSKI